MKIKIEGLITAERLAEALLEAQKLHGDHLLGFYGAHLYLTAYNHEGQNINMVSNDDHQTEVTVTLNAAENQILKPLRIKTKKQPKSAEKAPESLHLKSTWAMKSLSADQQRLDRQTSRANAQAERDRLYHEITSRKEDAVQIQKRNEAVFAHLVKRHPETFLKDLNSALADIWEKAKPIYPKTGRHAGQVRPVPVFTDVQGTVFLSVGPEGDRAIRKVKTPISRLDHLRDEPIQPLYTYPEWSEQAVPAFKQIIARYTALESGLIARLAVSTLSKPASPSHPKP